MSLVVVDSEQAWLATTGCFIINGLMVGFMKVFSLIMIEYQDILEAPMSLLLFGASMMTSLIGIASPLSTYLSEKMSTQKLGVCAALLSTISIIILAFAYHILTYIMATILLGLSFSLIYIPTYSIPGKCHIKHQTFSQGIVTAGASFGTLMMPLVLAQIIYIYSIRGYVLILGAILLNFAVGALLMPTYIVSLVNPEKPVFVMCQDTHLGGLDRKKKLGRLRIYGNISSPKQGISWPPREIMVSLIFYAFGMGLIMNGYMILSGLFGAFARSFDLKITTSAYILIGHSCLDLVSRLLIGFFTDLKLSKRYLIYTISALILSAVTILTSLVQTIILFYCYVVTNAIFGSVTMVLHILVLSDLVGVTHLTASFAMYTFIQGGMAIICYYVVGKICDVTESYNYGVCSAGIMILLGAILIVLEVFITRTKSLSSNNNNVQGGSS